MARMEFKDVYDRFVGTLHEDKELYYAYQSNIAMSFVDELRRQGYKLPDEHKIANNAAKQFLDLLIKKSEHCI
ncbi:MAG: hypothetical protein GY853_16125 [PVC group bacterium]|nr:hypothetical protein [PVC group bacterium]